MKKKFSISSNLYLLGVGFLFVGLIYFNIVDGYVSNRGSIYYLSEDPLMFYAINIGNFLLSSICFLVLIFNYIKFRV